MKKQIKDKILELRKANEMTQQQLAEKLIVTPQAVSRWEKGETEPDADTLIKIAEIFNVSLDELISGDCASKSPQNINVNIVNSEEKVNKEPMVALSNEFKQPYLKPMRLYAIDREYELKVSIIKDSVIWGGLALVWSIIALYVAISEKDMSLFAANFVLAAFLGSSIISWNFNNQITKGKKVEGKIFIGDLYVKKSIISRVFDLFLIIVRAIVGPIFLIFSAINMAKEYSKAIERSKDFSADILTEEILTKYSHEIQ